MSAAPAAPGDQAGPAPAQTLAPASAICGLVLDFGGVIVRTAFETHAHTERLLGLAPGTLNWHGPFDPDGDPLWRDMLAGRLSERQYWEERTRQIARLSNRPWTSPQDYMRNTQAVAPEVSIRAEALAAIRRASQAGVRLALLSNEMDLFFGADFRQRLPVMPLFDAVIDATYSGILKPDARAYQAAAAAIGLPLDQCLMVDDQPRNVAGALAAGMQALAFDVLAPALSWQRVLHRLGLIEPQPVG